MHATCLAAQQAAAPTRESLTQHSDTNFCINFQASFWLTAYLGSLNLQVVVVASVVVICAIALLDITEQEVQLVCILRHLHSTQSG